MAERNQKNEKGHFEKQLVIFKLADEEFGVDISSIREIIKLEDITKIPNTENYIEGIINLRGRIILIIDLEKKIGVRSTPRTKDTRIVVIEVGDNTLGMIVDCCNEVLRFSSDQIEPAPELVKKKVQAEYLEGVGILKDRLIIILNLSKVMGLEELEKIKLPQ